MRKTILGIAGIAVALTLIGGATYAAWSDFAVIDGNESGAEHLTLSLGGTGVEGFSNVNLAPGVVVERQFVVASRNGDVVPEAALRLALTNLVGEEDGCQGNSEEIDQLDIYGTSCDDTAGVLYDASGQFISEARIIVNSTNEPTTDLANACQSGPHPRGGRQSSISLEALAANTDTTPINLLAPGKSLAPGQGVCVGIAIELPVGATNASQGDSASFDLEFLLDQIVP